MSSELQVTTYDTSTGKVVVLNGKTYSLLRLYQDYRAGGTFCLAVAGRTPLKADDLAEHWQVFRSGEIYLALDCRLFSYHLIQGEGAGTNAPRWPHLKSPPFYYAFIGPTEEAVQAQIRMALTRYNSQANADDVIENASHTPDTCGGPPAYLVRHDWL